MKDIYARSVGAIKKSTRIEQWGYWLSAGVVGVVAVLYTEVFQLSSAFAQYVFSHLGWWMLAYTPVMFVLARWMVERWSREAAGSGIPQVMAALRVGVKSESHSKELLSLKTILIKVVSSCALVMGGGIVGREGPTVQVSAGVFDWIRRRLKLNVDRHSVVVAGAAAGLAAAFNTPLGGIVFALEELSEDGFSGMRYSVITAVIIAGMSAELFLGSYLYLEQPPQLNLNLANLPIVLLVGVAMGVLGGTFGVGLFKIGTRIQKTTGKYRVIVWPALIGIAIAGMGIGFGADHLGAGRNLIVKSLASDGHLSWSYSFVKSVGCLLSYVSGAAGGIFAPSLAIGASIGELLSRLFSPEVRSLVVLVGMAGFLSAVTRAPFTSMVLAYEMTNTHQAVFLITVSVLVSSGVARIIDPIPFYRRVTERYLEKYAD